MQEVTFKLEEWYYLILYNDIHASGDYSNWKNDIS